MAFQTHWNRFVKLVSTSDPPSAMDNAFNKNLERMAKLAYAWGREDASVEQRLEDERLLAGGMNAKGNQSEGQTP